MLVIKASCLLFTDDWEEEEESHEDDFRATRTSYNALMSLAAGKAGLLIFLRFILGSSFLGVVACGFYYFYFCSINFAYSLRSRRFLAFLVSLIGDAFSLSESDFRDEQISGGVTTISGGLTLFFLSILALFD
jgi:Mn2+/Fe2+ NRAMP family transporter